MSLTRLATAADLEGVLALAERKTYARWPSQAEDPKAAALARYQRMREDDSWRSEFELWVSQDVTDFLLLQKRLVRGVSGDRESVVQDWFRLGPLLECAAEAARGHGSQFLTLEVGPGESHRLEALGYLAESERISVATADWPAPPGCPYSIRPAGEGDDFLIAVRNAAMLPHTVCAEREYDLSELTFRSMESIFQQVHRQDGASLALVLVLGQEQIGHLLLELNERSAYVYDLAVSEEHWGGKAISYFIRAGLQVLFQRRIPLMWGDVSASNQRALKFAQRFLGFTVDCRRYGRRL